MVDTPVALVIFNRPHLTAKAFARIAQVRPKRLFVIADGPRRTHPDDQELCARTREIVNRVDWDCDVVRDYSEANQGAWRRVSDGITAAFDQVDELIVLEDDCMAHPTFFPYCQELLERYRDDERVMHIAGTHFQAENVRAIPTSYTFARWNLAWGWATWKRAWRHFDLEVKGWPALRDTDFLTELLRDPRAVAEYRREFDALHQHPREYDAWDHAWSFACWSQSGLSILPSRTLVGNVGFGSDATHFPNTPDDPRGALVDHEMEFPLRHPPCVVQDRAADEFIIQTYVIRPEPSLLGRAYMALERALGRVKGELARHPGGKLRSALR
jgi:hypothetical protein